MQQRLYFSTLLLIGGLFVLPESISPEPQTPIPSFEKEIFPLIQQKCAIPACHGISQRPYFKDHDSIGKKAKRIQVRVGHNRRPMPPVDAEVSLSAEERQLILDWIAAGAPDN